MITGVDGAVQETFFGLGQQILHILRHLVFEVVEGGQTHIAHVVAAGEVAVVGLLDQFGHARGDELHGGGNQAGMRSGQGLPLVGVHADAVDFFASLGRGRDFLQRAVAGHAAGAEDDVSALIHGLLGRGSAPFGVHKGLGKLARMIGGDQFDVGLGGLGARFVALFEGDDGGNQVGAQHSSDGAGLVQRGSQHARQVTSLVFGEDQTGVIGQGIGLELIDADEHDVGILGRGLMGGVAQGEAHADNHIVAVLDELVDVIGVVLGVLGLDVLDVVFGQTQLVSSHFYAFPGRLVEAAVIDATHIGDETDLEFLLLHCWSFGRLDCRGLSRLCGRFFFCRGLSGGCFAAAGAERHDAHQQQCEQNEQC